ncbi:bifunctional adenosylcobinamide kinase/adenosylcobinamide-phosphate guanylyltransferase [Shewanella gaetbuli]|uniref:Bifunctional adenosylcobalamin biosynthesis protein n=1 Tax=Shewanella gaetbuli TaxID=220752 RepID=A0A9X1ZLQ2_9GAMM|nr:bifunctional adenosylcobinamide kinase/adenosylcobinamide-phosphate guanylyltransferase [Shewanella gaetbuli]MCL1141982.1 bifunctional adenosylcobinamide kinase/adenosylcobinamide-phosphate guanylyltransferase [Shewanella gaetbuli]
MLHLVIGGARSGKSRFAERQVAELVDAQASAIQPYYIATATAGEDIEMQQRIMRHQQDRLQRQLSWQVVESPLALAQTLTAIDNPKQVILVDCLTLYLTNHLLIDAADTESGEPCSSWHNEKQQLLNVLPKLQSHIVLVSNEVGSGIVPMGELSREFVDQAGWLNQAIAELADQVTLVVAGLPLALKPSNS